MERRHDPAEGRHGPLEKGYHPEHSCSPSWPHYSDQQDYGQFEGMEVLSPDSMISSGSLVESQPSDIDELEVIDEMSDEASQPSLTGGAVTKESEGGRLTSQASLVSDSGIGSSGITTATATTIKKSDPKSLRVIRAAQEFLDDDRWAASIKAVKQSPQKHRVYTYRYHCRKLIEETQRASKELAIAEQHESKFLEALSELEELKKQVADQQKQLDEQKKVSSQGPSFIEEESQKKDAGYGLYAKEAIDSGDRLGEYHGKECYRLKIPRSDQYVVWKLNTENKPEFFFDDTYVLWIYRRGKKKKSKTWKKRPEIERGVDGNDPLPGREKTPLRMMNHGRKEEDRNVDFYITKDHRIIFYADRPIAAGKELFWDYDPSLKDTDFKKTACVDGVKPYIAANPEEYVDVEGSEVRLKAGYQPVDPRSFLKL